MTDTTTQDGKAVKPDGSAAPAGQEGQPGTGAAGKEKPKGEGAKPPPEGSVDITRRGRVLTLPRERAAELAAAALDLSEREQAIADRERQLRSNEADFREYERLAAALQANPRLRQAFELAAQDPDAVLSATRARRGRTDPEDLDDDQDGEGGKGNGRGGDAVLGELSAVRRKLEELEGRDRIRSAEMARTRLETELDSALGDYPYLKGKTRATAEIIAKSALARGQARSPLEAAAIAAAEIREARREESERIAQESEARKTLDTASPSGFPGLTPDRKYTADDLSSGKIVSDASAALKKLFSGLRKG